jgi:hypothetical protein
MWGSLGAQMLLQSSNGADLTQKIATGRPYEEMQSGDFLLVVVFLFMLSLSSVCACALLILF